MVKGGMKGTKQWRKKSDVKDIEETMNEIEKEKLTGGQRTLMKNEELFFVDKGTELTPAVKKSRKGLKIDDILAPNKHVKSFGVQKKKAKELGIADKNLIKKKVNYLEKEKGEEPAQVKKQTRYDLWDASNTPSGPIFEGGYDNPRAKLPKKIPHRALPSILPAVRTAHPGNSYRPSPEAHSEILSIAAEEEVNKITKEKKLSKLIGRAAKNVTEQAKNYGFLESIRKETSIDFADDLARTDGLLEASELNKLIEDLRTSEQVGEEVDGAKEENDKMVVKQTNPIKEAVSSEDRKTKRDKKKEKRKIEQARAERKKKLQQRRNKKFQMLPKITQEVEEALKEQKVKSEKRKQALAIKEKTETKRLGRQEFAQPDIDILLPSELPSSLRHLKPEGSLLKDRAMSLMERNIIAPAGKQTQPRRRYELKVTDTKWREYREENPTAFKTKRN